MVSRFTAEPYRNATTLSKHIFSLIMSCKEPCKEAALLMREWRETEQMKREWRGLPRLATTSMRELVAAKREQAKTIEVTTLDPFTEPSPTVSKESIIEPQTVTAPPTQDAP